MENQKVPRAKMKKRGESEKMAPRLSKFMYAENESWVYSTQFSSPSYMSKKWVGIIRGEQKGKKGGKWKHAKHLHLFFSKCAKCLAFVTIC